MKKRMDLIEDNAPSPLGTVRLRRAALCVNCEHISEATGEKCPRCGSPSLLSLARILNREEVA